MTHLLAALLIAATPPAIAAPARDYSVILEVKVDETGKVTEVNVAEVIDPVRAARNLKVEVDAEWLAAARADLAAKPHEPKARTYYTYFPYTPGLPYRPR
ncbi:hypothetical protein [Sphingomonas sp. G-3-2-10]|jgi:hypothetical protein|uniref:hypothetical protein n=1 Tax=Sphingomonas sp. G-3-2-10 TaxID=2728838 RepID=UPI00146F914D|nr:hypothetical protein [Sphingomonas sp. G-3-2-10]NML06165.1 hypothetical protein [Sphingomonas sp. G-3-2-10]